MTRALEFALLFVALPLVMALALPPHWVRVVLPAATLLTLALLARTPGFRWRGLVAGGVDWRGVGLLALATAAGAGLLVWLLVPQQALALPRRAPGLWLAVMLLYPLLSALPQELMFRALFFERYAALFPSVRAATAANALAFGLAHLMFWNWVAITLTVIGGLVFADAYRRRGFATAVAMHAVAGCILFTSGLGTFFYHGAVR